MGCVSNLDNLIKVYLVGACMNITAAALIDWTIFTGDHIEIGLYSIYI
jgi:hypothetical protein